MRGMSGGKLALGGWMQAVQDGNWIQPLGDSVRALNAGSGLVSWTGDGATAPTRLALRGTAEFARFCDEVLSQACTEVFSHSKANQGQLTWTHVRLDGEASGELGFFVLSEAPIDSAHLREIALVAAMAVATRARVRQMHATSELKTAAFDQLPFGTVIVDRQIRIAERNEAFGALVARGDGFSVCQGRLVCRDPSDQAALATAVSRALDGELNAALLKVQRTMGAQPYVMRLVASRGEARALEHCLLMIADPDEAPSPGADIWRAMFDLTECELIIAEGLVSGRRINDIATERGVSIETVRSQTKRMFERLNVSSQAEAAARLSRTAPFRRPTRPAS